MFRPYDKHRDSAPRHGGLTLVEMMIAMSIMAIVVVVLATLARAVQLSAEYGDSHAEATHHARVVIERITRTVREATTSDDFPGFLVVADTIDGNRYPDMLVVWHPAGAATDPEGLPRYSELVIYCLHGDHPNRLMEITAPNNSTIAPPADDEAGWSAAVATIRGDAGGNRATLTGLVRTCLVPTSTRRGAVRFESRLRPSDDDLALYRDETLTWDELPWVQGIYGSHVGLRQAWLRIELQLMPGAGAAVDDPAGQQAIPFLGSAALYYEVHQ